MPPKASYRVKLPPKQKKNDTLYDPVEYVGHGGSHGGERVIRGDAGFCSGCLGGLGECPVVIMTLKIYQRENYMSIISTMKFRCSTFCVKYNFLIEVMYFLKTVGDGRGSTFDHSARIRPALPGLQVVISRFSAASYKDLSQV